MSPDRDGNLKPDEISCQCIPEVGEGQRPPQPMPRVEVEEMVFDKPAKGEEIYLSPETVAALKGRVDGCFLCRFILEDQEKNGKLTGYPLDGDGKGIFPVDAKMIHIQLEKRSSTQEEPGATKGA